MKRFAMMSPKVKFAAAVIIISFVVLTGMAVAQTQNPAPISAHVTFSKSTFNLDDQNENISAVITIKNNNPDSVWTKKGFSETGYHLFLYFYGPLENNPKLLKAITSSGIGSTTPSVPPLKEPVEELYPGASDPNGPWFINMDITELRNYYPLTQPGQYKVWFSMPFVQYDPQQVEGVDNDGDQIIDGYAAPPDALIWTDPIDTQETYITLVAGAPVLASDIRVIATEYTFSEGERPVMSKKPLSGVEVRLYETSNIEAAGIKNISYKTYADIATNPGIPYKLSRESNIAGEFICKSVEQGNYVIIIYASSLTDYKYIGSPATIEAKDPTWGNSEILRELILLTNYRGEKSPGKSIKVTGSELLIIQPEYVEWDTGEELYPIGFVTLDNWDVEVFLDPPSGFLADQPELAESVYSGVKALQFTVTDMGGSWIPTKIKYIVKHKKKSQEIYNEIGVKLTRKLAKEKKVSEWGEDDQGEDEDDQGENKAKDKDKKK